MEHAGKDTEMAKHRKRTMRRLLSAGAVALTVGTLGVLGPMSAPAHAYGSATYSSSCSCSYGIKWCANSFGQTYNAGYC